MGTVADHGWRKRRKIARFYLRVLELLSFNISDSGKELNTQLVALMTITKILYWLLVTLLHDVQGLVVLFTSRPYISG